jgi:thiol-disulfide isomerase/thioredoxin
MRRSSSALPLLLLLLPPAAGAGQPSLPGCEAPSAIRKIVKDRLNSPEFNRLAYDARIERKQQVLSKLMDRYPREVEPYNLWIATARDEQMVHPELLAGLQNQYRERETAHPDDPFALYIAATALRSTDTPESIRLLDHAQSVAPAFVWPSFELSQIYSSGKFADKAKFGDQLTKFWTACPASQNQQARWMLVKNPELQAKVVAALRPMLEKATDPERLQDYEFLWGLEFRTTPPPKYGELRQQVAADVKRLEGVENPHPDAKWAQLLINGNKQAGASPTSIAASEDALLAKYPHSDQSYGIIAKRWTQAHPEPDAKDVAAWKTYRAEWVAVGKQWMENYPDAFSPPETYRYLFAWNLDDALDEKRGLPIMEAYLTGAVRHYGPTAESDSDEGAADNLLEHNWAPARALELLKRSRELELDQRSKAVNFKRDDQSDTDLKDEATAITKADREYTGQLLLAAMRAQRPDAVTPTMKKSIAAPRATDDKDESAYWVRRARLAAIEGQQQDALGYYQLALRMRPRAPGYERGKLQDDLGDEAHALWKERGGSDVAWVAWSAPTTSADAAKADDARWEKPTKTLPTFELADLSGKTWSVKSLNGKVVLLNLWATWCGPCNAELPQLQKLYEQTKGRSDLQILTLNVDEDPGLIEPFMKEKGYTFPVVPAYSYVVNLLNGYAIPQSWVLDAKGQWDWTQVGYGSDDAWVKDMIAKLDAVKAGS